MTSSFIEIFHGWRNILFLSAVINLHVKIDFIGSLSRASHGYLLKPAVVFIITHFINKVLKVIVIKTQYVSKMTNINFFSDNINVQLKEKIMRIKKMITKENAFISSISHCLFIKEMYGDQS